MVRAERSRSTLPRRFTRGATASAVPAAIPRLPGTVRVERLDNGLTVALVDNPQAPLVTTALCYRAGSRDERPGQGGIAHFLEHMMFKGSERFGPGEVDRRTQTLGGANNAFTSHDATVYYFNFAADRWQAALEIEADRMAGLTLDPREVESERRVILEEIAMYEDDPWDALTQRLEAAFFGDHPYGRPVLGTREELLATGPDDLAAFHGERYRPDGAVLVVAGDLSAGGTGGPNGALDRVSEAFGGLASGASARLDTPQARVPGETVRIERRRGEVSRLLVFVPAPPAEAEGFPAARVLGTVLGAGRGSRLYRTLVDDGQLCSWAAAGLSEALDPTTLSVAAEVLPGVEPRRVEEAVFEVFADLARRPPSADEMERARQVLLADWAFGHERISQQALALSTELGLLGEGWTARTLRSIAECSAEEVLEAARRSFAPAVEDGRAAVVGWSLPAAGIPADERGEETA